MSSVCRYARVAVETKARALNRLFTYMIPEEYAASAVPGCAAEVPFGSRNIMGIIVEVFSELSEEDRRFALRPVIRVVDAAPFWGGELMKLAGIMRRVYAGTWYESFQTIVPAPVLKRLKDACSNKKQRRVRGASVKSVAVYPALPLTSAQEAAVEAVCASASDGRPVLLYGVTGSGKTEVYLQAIQRVLDSGRQAMVLVPELSLTPQAVERYRGRLGSRVGILHSALSEPDRRGYWWAMRRGELQVSLGTRSSVFAPFDNLGIICVDEEHETSYKQEQRPCYHARQIAFMRAKENKAALVLGSATPSVESFYAAKRGDYRLVELPSRPGGRSLPPIRLVDMKEERSGRLVSAALEEALRDRLSKGEQSILLLNRRGFAASLQCSSCGFVPACPHCSVSLTWHRSSGSLVCHYCDYRCPVDNACPKCGAAKFRAGTPGTERLAAEITRLFPQASILRMDRDTTGKVGSHEAVLKEFGDGGAQILLGTKMIAKGLDYPNVTLVGILRADAELNIPDFRSGERTFQLLAQAAGRAGRGSRGGEVIIQAWDVDHPVLEAASRYDYLSMYRSELESRKVLLYPPYCRLVRLVFSGEEENFVKGAALHAAQMAASRLKGNGLLDVVGPAPCLVERIKGMYRWHLLVKCSSLLPAVEACSAVTADLIAKVGNRLHIALDPDPQSIS